MQPTDVVCHSGYKADEYPRSFTFEAQRLTVVDIEDRWYSPDCSWFRVFADDACRYLLRLEQAGNAWTVAVISSPPPDSHTQPDNKR
jgi:hypothetical protein